MVHGNPISHSGLEKDKRCSQRHAVLSRARPKMEQGMLIRAQTVARHEHHKNRISSGVKIKFASGLMIEIGIPQEIKSGSDMSEITN